jgi:tripartite-type tricarboxylate transporter receptor subunit TctC
MAEKMRALLGQPFVIENVTGANGSIGVSRAVRAIADGYTLSLGSNSTHALNGVVYTLGHDLLEDLEPVALLAGFPQVVVGKKGIPDNDLSGLIVWLKGTSKNSDLRGFVRV